MKLTLLNGGLSADVSKDSHNLTELIKSELVLQKTESAIAELIGKIGVYSCPDMESEIIEPLVSPADASVVNRQGVCRIQSDGKNQFLLINNQFPDYLWGEGGFESESNAALFAAIYSRALEALNTSIAKGARYRTLNSNFSNSLNLRHWGCEFQHGNNNTIYRAAGLVAIQATDVEPDFSDKPPYEPHLAGIIDPLPRGDTRSLGFTRFSTLLMNRY